MEDRVKKSVLKITIVYATIGLILSLIIFIINWDIYISLLIGFVYFLYSLRGIYMHYQEVSREKNDTSEMTNKGLNE